MSLGRTLSLRGMLLAATVLAAPSLASAQPVTGLYIGAGAGANWINNPERLSLRGFGFPPGVTVSNAGKANFDPGWTGVLSLGWGFGNGLRAEIEGNFRENEVTSIRGLGLAPIGRTGGFQRSYGVMGNVFYDFDFANFGLGQSVFQPYIGVGLGYVWTDWHNIRGVSVPTGLVLHADDTDGRFAYQAIVGVGTPLTWAGVPGLTLTAEYRFMGTLEPRLNARLSTPAGATVAAGQIETEKYNHSFLIGLRYAFMQPRPAPAPVVA
ncbi:outer membrane protein, partial [Crenalkalicoccus roseus]|uniref:outer membrane protein n=1 Tax=Crenalkalicoccus roseus TaxID=1485588 RepID=UPI0010822D3E